MAISPHEHPCDIGTIDYSFAEQGRIKCRVCPREWRLTDYGWKVNIVTRNKPS